MSKENFYNLEQRKKGLTEELDKLKKQIEAKIDDKNLQEIIGDIEQLKRQIIEAETDSQIDDIAKKIEVIKQQIIEQTKNQLADLRKVVLNTKSSQKVVSSSQSFKEQAERGREIAFEEVVNTAKKAADWYRRIPGGGFIARFLESIA
jgi:DNA repair exonuclease SbcCD ATPase subunit